MRPINSSVLKCIALVILVLQNILGIAQKGIPFITNYTLPVNMSPQNYQIIQGDNNTMYVLNQYGVFSFDGYSWERLPVTGQPVAMAFIDNLFICGDQTVGYFKKNLKGVNVYVAVNETGTDLFYQFHHFNNSLYATGVNGIYRVRRVEPYKVEPYLIEKDSSQLVTDIFNVGEKLFVVKNKRLIYQVSKRDETSIPISLAPKEEFLFSFSHNKFQIFGTSSNKIYRFDGKSLTPIFLKDQKYIDASLLTSGISLNPKSIALSTLIGGCIIVTGESGETQHIINYSNGLPDDEVTAMGRDRQGGLWLIHGMGISRVDLSIPINSFQHISGLNGNILSVAKFDKGLFLGTSDGLYKLVESKKYSGRPTVETPGIIERKVSALKTDESTDAKKSTEKKGLLSRIFGRERAGHPLQEAQPLQKTNNEQSANQKAINRRRVQQLISIDFSYEKVTGINGKVSQLLAWDGDLLAASSTGLYCLNSGKLSTVIGNSYVYSLNSGILNKNTIFVGTWETLYSVINKNNTWTPSVIATLPNERVTSTVELSASTLLIGTDYKIYRVDIANPGNTTVKLVPTGSNNITSPVVRRADNDILVVTPTQIFTYYTQGDSVGVSQKFPMQGNYKAFFSDAGRTWLRAGNHWTDYPTNVPNQRIAKYLGLLDRVNYVNYTDSNEVWAVNGYNQLYRLTPTMSNDTIDSINLYIKQIIDRAGNSLNTNYVKLEPTNNAFKIKLGAPFYLKEKAIEYQYKLEGIMSDWTDWGDTPEKDFPFFPPGNHILQFRVRDAMGNISEIHEYPFSITPPFYQTIWFYLVVAAVTIALVTLLIRIRERKLVREKQILEEKVKERTKTIEEQKVSIEQQRDELKTRNEEILQQKEEIEAQRDEITAQRDQIISQNQDIIKSISYARRIQNAVMPSKEKTDSILNDYFILLKPRDIVSGDFYWMTHKDGKIIVTAADCTGHGVPGAFMSLLGITLLTEIVKNTDDIRPHILLNQLRANLKTALSQEGREHEAKDGMDIALSVIDLNAQTLMFAGAYNPLYLFRNSELQEYKADKMPVGIHISEKESFTLHEITLQKNDCLYMFSDGFIDQFGGEDNRKFMSKNFKELLKKISAKKMDEQKTILDNTIDQWMGPHDQLDDILVMGIRV
ncbi:MAG: SpoIIE family protein phosphatase [Bacteroidales bacterium]